MCFCGLSPECMHPDFDPQQEQGFDSSGDSEASDLSLVSRHLHRLQQQVNRLHRAVYFHRRTLDSLEVQQANQGQALLALFLSIILLLQLLRLIS